MGKKGVLLDNGKQARSSMALFWNNAQNKNSKDKTNKQEPPQEDMETRAASNLDKWKMHKEKIINKLYQKPQKKDKVDPQAEKEKEKKLEEQMDRELLQKHMNKHKPVSIPGFKNANHLKSKLHYEQVTIADNSTNVLKPRAPGEELTHEDIVQILREKKAKKDMQKAHKQRIEDNLRQRQQSLDLLMDAFPQQKLPQPKPIEQEKPVEKQPEMPSTIFKSELLQKIERGEHISAKPKQQKAEVSQEKSKNKQQQQLSAQPAFVPKFIPRAVWQK